MLVALLLLLVLLLPLLVLVVSSYSGLFGLNFTRMMFIVLSEWSLFRARSWKGPLGKVRPTEGMGLSCVP